MQTVEYNRYGDPSVLSLGEGEKPTPKPNEIRIHIKAVEVTKADCELRSFRFPVSWFWLPLRLAWGITKPRKQILGGYFAGVVDELGEDVKNFAVGDEVFGCCQLRLGAYAEFVCLPANYTIAPKPKNLNFVESAAVPLGALNAWHFLKRAGVKEGDKVLINGAGGSIGCFAVQLAKYWGAEVTAVDAAHKMDLLRSLGADKVIDYRQEDIQQHLGRYDVIFNMVVGLPYKNMLACLKPGGRYVLGNPRFSDLLRSGFTRAGQGKSVITAFAGEKLDELLDIKTLLEQGSMRAVVDRSLPLAQAAQAHRLVESEQRVGSVVLHVGDGR